MFGSIVIQDSRQACIHSLHLASEVHEGQTSPVPFVSPANAPPEVLQLIVLHNVFFMPGASPVSFYVMEVSAGG